MMRQNCAIYTRKSSEEGLDQGFNSLDAQREACAAYIVSQKHEGWRALPDLYDDGGLSGGTMERPALQRLLADIKADKVQVVVVYKVDRLTRSLIDFGRIVDILDTHGTSFVSVTQQFNTTTSMGRLTLNMLLSFAQFEREIAGERIRDKIAASKAKGMWMGGVVPLGYDAKDRRLIVNEAEADTVRLIFRRYAELGSVRLLSRDLALCGIVSKRRKGDGRRLQGGSQFSRGALYLMLQNRLYRGEVRHKGNVFPGQHESIIDEALWTSVQDKLAAHRRDRAGTAEAPSLLAGLIVDADGRRLTPTHASKQGKRYRYYVSTSLPSGRAGGVGTTRIPAREIECLVIDEVRSFLGSKRKVGDALVSLGLDAPTLDRALRRAAEIAAQWMTLQPKDHWELVRALIQHVTVAEDRVDLSIGRSQLAQALGSDSAAQARVSPPVVVSIAAQLQRSGKGKRIVIDGDSRREVNEGLVRLLQETFAVSDMLHSGSSETLNALTRRLGKSKGHLTWLMRLTYLSPEIVVAVLTGGQPAALTPRQLLRRSRDLPHDWAEQKRHLGFVD
jgi:site-specific DNA recombinase